MLQDEAETFIDKKWLDLYAQSYIATPIPHSITETVTPFCQHFHLDVVSNLETIEDRRVLLGICRAQPADKLAELPVANVQGVDKIRVVQQLQDILRPNFEDQNLSVYSYTMDSLYATANLHMNSPQRCTLENGLPAISSNVRAILPWLKKVDAGLSSLPASFRYLGTLFRVMSHVFDSLSFDQRFKTGNIFVWHSFRSASRSEAILSNPSFTPGTVFEIRNAVGTDITLMSQFTEECEILLRPGTTLQVMEARKGTPGGDVRESADWIVVEMLAQNHLS